MPPFPPVPNVIKIEITGTISGEACDNVFHQQYTGATPSAAACLFAANSWAGSWETRVVPRVNNNYQLTGCRVVDLASDTGQTGLSTTSAVGGVTTEQDLNSACFLINWQIARRYRGGKPRTYVGGPSLADRASPKSWSAGTTAGLTTAFQQVKLDVEGIASSGTTFTTMGIVSYYDKVLNPVAPFRRVTPVFFATYSPECHVRVCSQRRRLGKG